MASPSSPYLYSAYHSQSAPSTSSSSTSGIQSFASLRDKLLKSSSTNRVNITASKEAEDKEKLAKQLQLALIYRQMLALQQYRSLYGNQALSEYYPQYLAQLQRYYGQGDPSSVTGMDHSAGNTAAASSINSEISPDYSSSVVAPKGTLSELQQQQLAALAFRRQVMSRYGSLYGGSGGTGSYETSASSLYGDYASPGLSGYSGLYGSGGAGIGGGYGYPTGSAYSSLYGSAMPTGAAGILSQLTSGFANGLSNMAGGSGPLGMLSTLGYLFG